MTTDGMFGKRKSRKKATMPIIKDKAYWEAKHPVVEQMYEGRPLPGRKDTFEMDVRHFFCADDFLLKRFLAEQKLIGSSFDDTVLKIQDWVCRYISYTPDSTLGVPEFWMFAPETIGLRRGDCEDGAILIGSLIANAIPPEDDWRVNISAGYVQQAPTAPEGGHGWVSLCRPSDNEFVVVDWCFYPDQKVPLSQKILQKDNVRYKEVWFSFNHRAAHSHVTFDLSGRIKKNVAPKFRS